MSTLGFRNDLVSKLTAATTPDLFTFSDPVITQYVLKVRLNPPGTQNSFTSHHNSRLLDQDLTHKPNNMNLQNTKQFVIVVDKWALAWSCCLGLILRAARLVPDVSSGKIRAENSLLLNQSETAQSHRYLVAENFRVSRCVIKLTTEDEPTIRHSRTSPSQQPHCFLLAGLLPFIIIHQTHIYQINIYISQIYINLSLKLSASSYI